MISVSKYMWGITIDVGCLRWWGWDCWDDSMKLSLLGVAVVLLWLCYSFSVCIGLGLMSSLRMT